jgi:hypothetical protein
MSLIVIYYCLKSIKISFDNNLQHQFFNYSFLILAKAAKAATKEAKAVAMEAKAAKAAKV